MLKASSSSQRCAASCWCRPPAVSPHSTATRTRMQSARLDAMFGTPDRYRVACRTTFSRPRRASSSRRGDRHSPSISWRRSPTTPTSDCRRRRHGRPELGGIQPHRRPVVVDTGLRPAVQVHGERARRGRPVHPGADRRLRQGRPVGPAAVRRPRQRSGLLALHRLCATIGLTHSSGLASTRQELNVGVNKTFNYDADFRRVPSPATRRPRPVVVRHDGHSSSGGSAIRAVVVGLLRDPVGHLRHLRELECQPRHRGHAPRVRFLSGRRRSGLVPRADRDARIRAAERVVRLRRNAALLGRPAIDFQMAYERNWSNSPTFDYSAWHVGAALKLGWRF